MIKNYFKHFKTVCIHKYWVFHYCKKAGISWRGIKHDMSKFSPLEFIESAKHYDGGRSPIDACKEKYGVSKAWLHHKGRNTHHYEYHIDNFDRGGEALPMPFEDALEMLCDYLGAGRAYQKDKFTYEGELQWWYNKKSNPLAMHQNTQKFITLMLENIAKEGIEYLTYKNAEHWYRSINSKWNGEI